MGEQIEATGTTWNDDWAKAEAQASAFEKKQESGLKEGGTEDPGQVASETSEHETPSSEEGEQSDTLPEGGDEAGEAAAKDGVDEDRSTRIQKLRDEAKDLGFEVDANSVTVADRHKFREERRKARAKLQADYENAKKVIEQQSAEIQEKAEGYQKFQDALEVNDLDGLARAIGREGWNALADEALKRQMSPEHKELVELRQRQREQEKRAEQERERQSGLQAQKEREQARENYARELSGELSSLKNKTLSAFADDPQFIQGVMYYQEQEWDGEETISTEEAAQRALEDARLLYKKLRIKFGDQAADQSETKNVPAGEARSAERPRRKPPKTVSQRDAAEASADDDDDFDPKQWERKWASQMAGSRPDAG